MVFLNGSDTLLVVAGTLIIQESVVSTTRGHAYKASSRQAARGEGLMESAAMTSCSLRCYEHSYRTAQTKPLISPALLRSGATPCGPADSESSASVKVASVNDQPN